MLIELTRNQTSKVYVNPDKINYVEGYSNTVTGVREATIYFSEESYIKVKETAEEVADLINNPVDPLSDTEFDVELEEEVGGGC